MLTRDDFEDLMPLVRIKWPSWSYHPFSHNCHHFTDFLCRTLGFPAGPKFGLFASGDPKLAEEVGQTWRFTDVFRVASCFPSVKKSTPQHVSSLSSCGGDTSAFVDMETKECSRQAESEDSEAIVHRDY